MKPRGKSGATHRFLLYVAGGTVNSAHAIANLNAVCEDYLPGRYEIEVIDVFRDPDRALEDEVCMTPTLIRVWPAPVRRVVGSLSQRQPLLAALDIASQNAGQNAGHDAGRGASAEAG